MHLSTWILPSGSLIKKNDYFISKKGIKLYESINILSKDYNLLTICNALNVNRSSYLYWLNTGIFNEEITTQFYCQIIQVYADSNGIYGSPKITAILNKKGIDCSISKVAKAMHLLGIRSIVSKKFPHRKSTLTNEEKSLIVNLIKDLDIVRINHVWTTDVTYIPTINEGTFYLISYIDYFSKKVVA